MAKKGLVCTNCGNKLKARDKFCAICGTSVEAMAAEVVSAEVVASPDAPEPNSKPAPPKKEKTPKGKKEKKPGWFYRRVVLYLVLLIILVVGIGLLGMYVF